LAQGSDLKQKKENYTMRFTILGMSALALAAVSAPAFAQDEPTPEITVTGSATVVSDYRFRGISQTDKRFAVQGGFTVSHASGFYASVWGSSVDDYIAAGSDQEIDFIGGYTKTIGAATVDVGLLYYYYPGSSAAFGPANTDFFEPYASVKGTFGPATAKLGVAYAPKQAAIGLTDGLGVFHKEDNLYAYGELSGAVGPISLTSHLGYSHGPSFLTIGDSYWDWNVGASYTWNHLTFGVSYVDTNKAAFSPSGRNVAKAGVVGTLGVSF
jgi:uncharacterized protein (TIGR02001 family)